MPSFTPATVGRALAVALVGLTLVADAGAQAVRAGFRETRLFGPSGRDDGPFSPPIAIGFDVNFYGFPNADLLVCNNGFVQFNPIAGASCPFTLPSSLANHAVGTFGIIAPFFTDLDSRIATRPDAYVGYGAGVVDGREGFGVTWLNVPGFNAAATPNTFQMILWNYADRAPGDFRLEFNYNSILLATAARVGFAADRGVWGANAGIEFTGSGTANQFQNGGPRSLASGSNVGIAGRYCFDFANGQFSGAVECATPYVPPAVIPEPSTYVLMATGLGLLGGIAARRRRQPAA